MKRTTSWDMRENNNTKDRISELPDSILTHILSFLDTKYSVQTSALSKRWINLWTSLTNLNFHCNSFRKMSTFKRFIDHVLTRRDNSIGIDSFVFISKKTMAVNFFERVINYATSHRVKHLEVCIHRRTYYSILSNSSYSIPSSTFSDVSSLTTLKLKNLRGSRDGFRDIHAQFCFERLQFLSLEGFSFIETDLFSRCPNLVELSITDCRSRDSNTFKISAPQLERLNISFGPSFSRDWGIDCEIVLSLPKLTSFNFKSSDAPVVLLTTDDLLLLENVRIDLDSYELCELENKEKFGRDLMNMLQKLHSVQQVSLSMAAVELLYAITVPPENPPLPFLSLKSLTFDVQKYTSNYPFSKPIAAPKRISLNVVNQVMYYLLQNSPNAEMFMEFPRCHYCMD